jgi:hypothetical protein
MPIVIEYTQTQFQIIGDVGCSTQLLKLLDQCPNHMKCLSRAEIFQETMQWVWGAFSFLLEPRPGIKSTTSTDFIAKIRESYDSSNPKTSYAIAVLAALESLNEPN